MSRLLKGLKGPDTATQTPSPSPLPDSVRTEMNALYQRLSSNVYADSNELRTQILGRMIFLLFTALYK